MGNLKGYQNRRIRAIYRCSAHSRAEGPADKLKNVCGHLFTELPALSTRFSAVRQALSRHHIILAVSYHLLQFVQLLAFLL
jgi:hypothetical protein